MNCPSSFRLNGPLAIYREAFWSYLIEQRYKRQSAMIHMYLFAHLSRWLAAAERSPDSIDSELVDAFVVCRQEAGYAKCRSRSSLSQILAFLDQSGVVDKALTHTRISEPHDERINHYRHYLSHERSLTESVSRRYSTTARQFLVESLGSNENIDIEALMPSHILAFIHAKRAFYSVGTIKLVACELRSFLRYLFLEGLISRDLRGATPMAAHTRQSTLPQTLDRQQIQQLLSSCDCRQHNGRRAHAMLQLMVRLGLRQSDVAWLTLDDIDWAAGELRVCGKNRREDRLPLPEEIGNALFGYLRHSRPQSEAREVFLMLRAPYRALEPYSVGEITRRALLAAGLASSCVPRLRHTAASTMLNAGASLDEVAQVLRHRSINTTAIYAKLDDRALGQLIREWPEASR